MQTEEKLIPYHGTDLTGKKVLVLAPHPDDEIIGCGGSLALHSKAGDPVKVVFLTNGAKGDTSGAMDSEEYCELRRNEAVNACAHIAVTDLEFWSYEDRSLAGSPGALLQMIDLLEGFRPELVYVPSPLEFHPDHRATSILFCDAIRSCEFDFDVAFYEVGQPLRVNLLVDITKVLTRKIEAMDAYRSQLKERPYRDICLALNRYRSMTLPEGATHAEGFSRWGVSLVRKIGPFSIPFQQIERLRPDPGEAGPLVSVIIRTKDRPARLADALRSVTQQTYANLEIVVVNDGALDVKDVVTVLAGSIPVTYISHKRSEGRAAAANKGLEAARGVYLNFLDDDDIFYPDHLETLVTHLQASEGKVAYSSVLSAHFSGPPERPENCVKRVVNHNVDFDPDRILFQNYIPIMSVLFHRDVLSRVDGFSRDLNLFEDWDFWIRASRHFPFDHIDRVTAEYRFYGSETTEESHRQKYRYNEAQAEIFDRAIPFLTGAIWTKFLNTDLFDQLRHGEKCQNGGLDNEVQLEQTQQALMKTDQRLEEAYGVIEKLRTENESSKEMLTEILSSKGWRWLNRLRALKLKLGFQIKENPNPEP